MKKHKILLFCIILLYGTMTTAQDANNPATWEKTIAFINKYSDAFGEQEMFSRGDTIGDGYYPKNIEISDKGILTYSYGFVSCCFDKSPLIEKVTIADLTLLKEIYIVKSTGMIKLILTGNYVINKYPNNERTSYKLYVVKGLFIDDSEMHARMLKAFKHLAYLATKKRQEDILNSDDGF